METKENSHKQELVNKCNNTNTKNKTSFTEENEADKLIRSIVRNRIYKGSTPLKELEGFLRKWIELIGEKQRPIVILSPKNEDFICEPCKFISPAYGFQDRDFYKIDAIKWKTRKAKSKGQDIGSPIDIKIDKVKKCKYYRRFIIFGLWDTSRKTAICNSGKFVIGTLEGEVLLSGGPLFGTYQFKQFHFHYADQKYNGSEHTINGQRFTLEMHILFIPKSCEGYPSKVMKCQSTSKVIFSLLFKESKVPSYYELFSFIPHIMEKGKKLIVANNLLSDFKHVLSSSEYYNYVGCCTEEPFYPNTEWIIFKEVLPIHRSQMNHLWQKGMLETRRTNIRPTQRIGERTVYEPSYKDHVECRGNSFCKC